MELIALVIKKYEELFEEQCISFTDRYRITYKFSEDKLEIQENPEYISNFYGDKILNISMISGINGRGKSRILNMLIHYDVLQNKNTQFEEYSYCLIFMDDNQNFFAEYTKAFCNKCSSIKIDYLEKDITLNLDSTKAKKDYAVMKTYKDENAVNDSISIGFLNTQFKEKFKRYSSYYGGVNKVKIIERNFDIANPNNIVEAYEDLFNDKLIESNLRFKLDIRWQNVTKYFLDVNEDRDTHEGKTIDRIRKFTDKLPYFLNKTIADSLWGKTPLKVWKELQNISDKVVTFEPYVNGQQQFVSTHINFSSEKEDILNDFNKSFKEYLDDKHKYKSQHFPDIELTMSTGENNVVSLMSQIRQIITTEKDKKHYVILVDELETGMHLEWSRKIIGHLSKITNKASKDNKSTFQFILTTHSPFMLSDIKPDNVISLEKKHGKTVVKEHTNTFAKNIQEIMNDDMFISNIYGDFALSKINSLIKELREEKGENRENLLKEINMIGEPILRNKLLDMYNQKYCEFGDKNLTLLDKMNLTDIQRREIMDILKKENKS